MEADRAVKEPGFFPSDGFCLGSSFCLRVLSSQVAWTTDFCQITSLLAPSCDFSWFLPQHGSPWLADAVAMVSDVAWEREGDWLSRWLLLTPRLLWSPANLLITGLSGGCCWAPSLEADLLRQSRRAESLHFSEGTSYQEGRKRARRWINVQEQVGLFLSVFRRRNVSHRVVGHNGKGGGILAIQWSHSSLEFPSLNLCVSWILISGQQSYSLWWTMK